MALGSSMVSIYVYMFYLSICVNQHLIVVTVRLERTLLDKWYDDNKMWFYMNMNSTLPRHRNMRGLRSTCDDSLMCVPQVASPCWGWKVEPLQRRRFQPPLCTSVFWVFSVGAPSWLVSTTKALSTLGRPPVMTGTPGLRWNNQCVSLVNGVVVRSVNHTLTVHFFFFE